jgi:radical SAM protein with 4Fe4S-binding SPASM domain
LSLPGALPWVRIPASVVSKTVHLAGVGPRSIAYGTRAQSVSVFEDESAAVWRLLYESRGDTGPALSYVAANGTFDGNAAEEARSTLLGFLDELEALGLVEGPGGRAPLPEPAPIAIVDGGSTTEFAFAELMAAHRVFYSLVLELTYRCNEACVHCYCPEDREIGELTLPQIEDLLDEFQALGGFSLQLTGGEIFVRRDIRDLLRSLRRRRLLFSITSNLTLVDDETADLIADLHPKSVACSIYSAHAEEHDAVTRRPGSFMKSVEAIRMLRSRGVPTAIKTPLMASTAAGWRDVVALAESLGCASQFDLNITARNDGDRAPLDLRVHDASVIEDILRSAFPRVFFGGEQPAAPRGPSADELLCGAGATGLTVSPDGTFRPCIALTQSLGTWPADSLADVWPRSPFFQEWSALRLRDVDKCSSCQVASHCIRCPGGWLTESGGRLVPPEYSCQLSRVRSGLDPEPSCGLPAAGERRNQ